MKTIVFCCLVCCFCSSVWVGNKEKVVPSADLNAITGGQGVGSSQSPALCFGIPDCVVNNSTCPGRNPCNGVAEFQVDANANLDCLTTSDSAHVCTPEGFKGICVSYENCVIDPETGQCVPSGGGDREAYAACEDNFGSYP